MITFCLIVNRQCQSRFARYYGGIPKDRSAFERDVARRCIIRKPGHVSSQEGDGNDELNFLTKPAHSQCHFFSTDDVGKIGTWKLPVVALGPKLTGNDGLVFRRYASLYFIFGCDSEEVKKDSGSRWTNIEQPPLCRTNLHYSNSFKTVWVK